MCLPLEGEANRLTYYVDPYAGLGTASGLHFTDASNEQNMRSLDTMPQAIGVYPNQLLSTEPTFPLSYSSDLFPPPPPQY